MMWQNHRAYSFVINKTIKMEEMNSSLKGLSSLQTGGAGQWHVCPVGTDGNPVEQQLA